MANGKHNPEPGDIDPEQVVKLLEIELMQKRARWQQEKGRRGMRRALSFLFLMLVIIAALAAYFLLSPERLREGRGDATAEPTPAESPR